MQVLGYVKLGLLGALSLFVFLWGHKSKHVLLNLKVWTLNRSEELLCLLFLVFLYIIEIMFVFSLVVGT